MNFINVNSSNIHSIALDNNDLLIKFHNGGIYKYMGAANHFNALLNATSKGKYFIAYIKDNYPCNKL